jgi:hypothetical protein
MGERGVSEWHEFNSWVERLLKAVRPMRCRAILNFPITKLPNYSISYRPFSSSLNMYLIAGL